jgi:hypothetical protein
MTATRTTIDAAVYAAIQPGLTKTFAQSTPLIDIVNGQGESMGGGGLLKAAPLESGDTINWKLQYSANSAGGDFAEGDTIPASGRALYADLSRSLQLIGVPVAFTGHAKDALSGNMKYFDALLNEINDGLRQLAMLFEAKVIAWLIEAIDDSATYAGQNRSTVHTDSVVVDADSATLSKAQLKSLTAQLRYRPREVILNPTDHRFIASPAMCDEYRDIYESTRTITPVSREGNLDVSLQESSLSYAGVPFAEINSLADTYVILMNMRDIIIRYNRPVTIEQLGKRNDNTEWWLTFHGGLAVRDPYRAGKIENIVL